MTKTNIKYYDVDDIPVIMYEENELVYTINDLGFPKNMFKVINIGREITEKEFDEMVAERRITLDLPKELPDIKTSLIS